MCLTRMELLNLLDPTICHNLVLTEFELQQPKPDRVDSGMRMLVDFGVRLILPIIISNGNLHFTK